MRRTNTQVQVAAALLADPNGRHWGYDLGKAADVNTAVMYRLLRRWLEAGYLTDGWEDPTKISGRPPRRYYELTDLGRRELASVVSAAAPARGLAARLGVQSA